MHRQLSAHHTNPALQIWWRWLNLPIALLIALGSVSIAAWETHYIALIQLLPANYSGIAFNTAVGFVLLGVGFLAALHQHRLVSGICGFLLLILSGSTLAEYTTAIHLDINHLFHKINLLRPGMPDIVMAPNTATCFFLSSILLLLEFWKKVVIGFRYVYWIIGAAVLCLALIALMGYLTGIPTAYSWGKLTGMALQTSLGFMVSGSLCMSIAWLSAPPGGHNRISILSSIALVASIAFALFNYQMVQFTQLKKYYSVWEEVTNLLTQEAELRINQWYKASETGNWRSLLTDKSTAQSLLQNIQLEDAQNLLAIYQVNNISPFLEARLASRTTEKTKPLPNFNWQLDDFKKPWWFLDAQRLWVGHTSPGLDMILFEFNLQEDLRHWLSKVNNGQDQPEITITINDTLPDPNAETALSYVNTHVHIRHSLNFMGKPYLITLMPAAYDYHWLDETAIKVFLVTLLLGFLISILLHKTLSLRLLRGLTDSIQQAAPSGLMGVNQSGHIIFANLAAENIFGYQPGELIGEKIEYLVPMHLRGQHKKMREHVHLAHESRSMGRSGLKGITKTGEEIPIDIAINYANTEHGKLAIASIIDMRIHHSLENELRLQRDKLEQLINSVGDGIFGMDTQGHVTFVNPVALHMLGYQKENLQQYPLLSRLQTNSHRLHGIPTTCPIYADFSAGRASTLSEATFWDVNDLPHSVEYVCTPLFTGEKLSGAVMIFRDISKRKAIELLMQEHAHKLETINQELEEFSYVASHDLREPLRTIKSYSSLLNEDIQENNSEEILKDIQYINNATDSMSELLEGLLLLSKAGRMRYQRMDVDLNSCLQDVMTNLDQLIREHEAFLDCPEPLPTVIGDPLHLTRVLQNLIHNGIKFHRANTKPYITIMAKPSEESGVNGVVLQWRIYVIDNGIGIDPKHHQNIFDAFKRLHSQKQYEGTGIGLAVVRRIIERHHGNVGIESTADGGSCFYFDLAASIPGDHHE